MKDPAALRKALTDIFNHLSDDTLRSFSVEGFVRSQKQGAKTYDAILEQVFKADDSGARLVETVVREYGNSVIGSKAGIDHLNARDAMDFTAWVIENYADASRKMTDKARQKKDPTPDRTTVRAILDGTERSFDMRSALSASDIEALAKTLEYDGESFKILMDYALSDMKRRLGKPVPDGWKDSPFEVLSPDAVNVLLASGYLSAFKYAEPVRLYKEKVVDAACARYVSKFLPCDVKADLAAFLVRPDESFKMASDKEQYLRGSLSLLGEEGLAIQMNITERLGGSEMKRAVEMGRGTAFCDELYRSLPPNARLCLAISGNQPKENQILAEFKKQSTDMMYHTLERVSRRADLLVSDRNVLAGIADGWRERAAARSATDGVAAEYEAATSERDYLLEIADSLSSGALAALKSAMHQYASVPDKLKVSDTTMYMMPMRHDDGSVEYRDAVDAGIYTLSHADRLAGVVVIVEDETDLMLCEAVKSSCEKAKVPFRAFSHILPEKPGKGKEPIDYTAASRSNAAFVECMDTIDEMASGEGDRAVLIVGASGRGMDARRTVGLEGLCREHAIESLSAVAPETGEEEWKFTTIPETYILDHGRSVDDPQKTVKVIRGSVTDLHYRSDGAIFTTSDNVLLMPVDDVRASSGKYPELVPPDEDKVNWGNRPVFVEGNSSSLEETIINNA